MLTTCEFCLAEIALDDAIEHSQQHTNEELASRLAKAKNNLKHIPTKDEPNET